MKITKKQLRRIIKEEKRKLVEYSDHPTWLDIQDSMDDVSMLLDELAGKYVTSGWLKDQNNAIADGVAKRIEKLYFDAEALGSLISGSGALKK